jgi:amidase
VSLAFVSATELVGALQRREISSSRLLADLLNRIGLCNPQVNAVIATLAEQALDRADKADAALARGQTFGPLHGLPMTVKESFNVAGLPTTWGHPALIGNVASTHAQAVQRLEDAGAIIFGKTNVPVSLADWQTFNPIYGTTNNPWDLGLTPGGSSGGSAAALAAGLTPLELGSDIGASIRNPAHFCGVYGHKPTWGVVPMAGHQVPGVECIDSLDIAVVGPLARSARDLQLAMSVLANPLQLFGACGWQDVRWRRHERSLQQCRISVVYDDSQARVDHSIQTHLHALSDFLRERGFAVVEGALPVRSAQAHRVYMHMLRAATGAMMDDAGYAQMQALALASDPSLDSTAERTWRGSTLSHRQWVAFDQQRWALRTQWQQYFEGVGLLIAPVATRAAFAHNQQGERWERMIEVNGQAQASTDALFWAGLPGLVGLPATAIPLGLTHEGLPVGAQIVGPWLADPLCLDMAIWLEDNWHRFTPPPQFTQ